MKQKSKLLYIHSHEPRTYNQLEEVLNTLVDIFNEQDQTKTRFIVVVELRKRGKK